MEKAYRFRIYPTKEQEELIQKTFGCVRYTWNYFLGLQQERYKVDGKRYSWVDMCNMLPEMKKKEPWLAEPASCSLQWTVRNLDTAYRNFFRRLKSKKSGTPESAGKTGFVRFKSKKNHQQSFYLTNSKNSVAVIPGSTKRNGLIKLPKLGMMCAALSREVEGRILKAVISQNPSGRYFAVIMCTDVSTPSLSVAEAESRPQRDSPQKAESPLQVVGIDFTLAIAEDGTPEWVCYCSDGTKAVFVRELEKELRSIRRLSKNLSRKKTHGCNWEKARKRIATLHYKIECRREDAHKKFSTELVRKSDVIVCPKVPISEIVTEKKDARTLYDIAWGNFVNMLKYKCEWYGKELVMCDQIGTAIYPIEESVLYYARQYKQYVDSKVI